IPSLAILIQNRGLRVIADLGGANFVNDFAALRNAPISICADAVSYRATHCLDNFSKRILHMLGLQNFVLTPFEMEAQHRNAPLVDNIGINLAIAVFVRNHLSAAGEVNFAAVKLT